jgi:hypothetical protein
VFKTTWIFAEGMFLENKLYNCFWVKPSAADLRALKIFSEMGSEVMLPKVYLVESSA